MKYLVREVTDLASLRSHSEKVFARLKDGIKYVRKANRNRNVKIGEVEATVENLSSQLKERLSTVTLVVAGEPGRRWIVTAFDATDDERVSRELA